MSLPNYSPSGAISFGAVPWGASYSDVRLYSSLSEQHADIASMMTVTSTDYAYIGRNRRIKVAIEADRLYHVNYCMYRNESLTDGWIYCFVTDVRYVNDNTTEVTIETDVFQTYLYGTDWTMPACFVNRETTASEDESTMLTSEPDFPLTYVVSHIDYDWFRCGGYMAMSAADVKVDQSAAIPFINPLGMYTSSAGMTFTNSVPEGAALCFYPIETTSGGSESLETFCGNMTAAGGSSSIVAIFAIPDFAAEGLEPGWQKDWTTQGHAYEYKHVLEHGGKGTWVGTLDDGYVPRNKKLLYYPYNFCRLTDMNGSYSELRYELMDNNKIVLKYALSPQCKALAYPLGYRGAYGFEEGIVVDCGALGSWNNDAMTTWMVQNAGRIELGAVMTIAGLAGGTAIADAVSAGVAASNVAAGELGGSFLENAASNAWGVYKGVESLNGATLSGAQVDALKGAAGTIGEIGQVQFLPKTARGQCDINLRWATGMQGIAAVRTSVKREVAAQIDQYFDMFGYTVDRVKEMELFSRPSWNYVKTVGCTPRSANVGSDSTAPFSRGRGTPASALAVIKRAFDSGITMWHTTSGFGNHLLDNTL